MVDFTGGTWRSLIDGSEVAAIPDSEIYLHDDWGDDKISNRDDSDTVTYNGVEGVYRPDWSVDLGDITVSNSELTLDSDPTLIGAEINLNLSETVRWFWEISSSGSGRDIYGLFADTNNTNESGWIAYEDSYYLANTSNDNNLQLSRKDASGNDDTLITDSDGPYSSGFIGAERQSDGSWELFATGSDLSDPKTELFDSQYSRGTATDTTYSGANYIYLSIREDTGSAAFEVKSF